MSLLSHTNKSLGYADFLIAAGAPATSECTYSFPVTDVEVCPSPVFVQINQTESLVVFRHALLGPGGGRHISIPWGCRLNRQQGLSHGGWEYPDDRGAALVLHSSFSRAVAIPAAVRRPTVCQSGLYAGLAFHHVVSIYQSPTSSEGISISHAGHARTNPSR